MLRYIDGRHAFSRYEEELKAQIMTLHAMFENVRSQYEMLSNLLHEGKEKLPGVKKEVRTINQDIQQQQKQLESNVQAILSRFTVQSDELRLILSMVKLAWIFERMGDTCRNCVKRAKRIDAALPETIRKDLLTLKDTTAEILEKMPEVLLHFDNTLGAQLIAHDDEVDDLYRKLVLKVPKLLENNKLSNAILSDTLYIAKNFERLADLLCEVVQECYYIHNGTRYQEAA